MAFVPTTQISCLFLVYIFWFLSLIPVRLAQRRTPEGYDNNNPKDQYERLDALGKRAKAVVDNNFEALVFYLAAALPNVVVITSTTGATNTASGALSIIYVVARAIYPVFYYMDMSMARSAVWSVGLLCIWGIWINTFINLDSINKVLDAMTLN